MKHFFGIHLRLTTTILACTLLLLSSCNVPGGEGFAIYLTKGDTPPSQMPALSQVDIGEHPVIAMRDIISYDRQTHEIALTPDAFNRIAALGVPVRGRAFVVCVDRKPVYWGAFWTPISSLSFDGITIWKPLGGRDRNVIKLQLGYPSAGFYQGQDPRSNSEIMRSLERAGKLTTVPSPAADKLPHLMKGWEVYSWQEKDGWHFTLMYGTNRNKTLEEIVSAVNTQDHIHVTGVDAIKRTLSRLPVNEPVFWLPGLRDPSATQTPLSAINITLPPKEIIDAITDHAAQCGLDFH